MNFYLFKDNQQIGPYSVEQLKTFLQQGLVAATDQVWADGWPAWMQISQVPGFAPEKASSRVVPPVATSSRKPPIWEFVIAILSFLTVWGGTLYIPALLLDLFGLHPSWSLSYTRDYLLLCCTSMCVIGPTIFDLLVPYLLKYLYESRPSSIPPSYAGWKRPSNTTIASMIIGTLVLIGVLGLGLVRSTNTASSPKTAIIAVVKQDHAYERAYAAGHETQVDQTDADIDQDARETASLATELEQIDLSSCPDDFKTAFTKRINAVRGIANVLSKHPHVMSTGEAVLSGMANGLVGAADQQAQNQSWQDNLQGWQDIKNQSGRELDAVLDRYGITPQDTR